MGIEPTHPIETVAKRVGRYNNGAVPEELSAFALNYFGDGEYENMIALIEVPTHPEIPLDIYVSRVGALLEILLGYAHMLHNTVVGG